MFYVPQLIYHQKVHPTHINICDATPRNQAECEKNIFAIFAVLESTRWPAHFGINFMKNGLILSELQKIEMIKCIFN